MTDLCVQIRKHVGRKLLKTVQAITTFRNLLADPVGTRLGPPLVSGPQFENRWPRLIAGAAQRLSSYDVIHKSLFTENSVATEA